jgi:hypothetical protein
MALIGRLNAKPTNHRPCYGDKGSEKTSHQRRWALLQFSLLRYEGLFMYCRDDSVPV